MTPFLFLLFFSEPPGRITLTSPFFERLQAPPNRFPEADGSPGEEVRGCSRRACGASAEATDCLWRGGRGLDFCEAFRLARDERARFFGANVASWQQLVSPLKGLLWYVKARDRFFGDSF